LSNPSIARSTSSDLSTGLQHYRRSSLGRPCNLRKRILRPQSPWRTAAARLDIRCLRDAPRCASLIHIDVGRAKHLHDTRIVRCHLLHLADAFHGFQPVRAPSAPVLEKWCLASMSRRQRHSPLFTTWGYAVTVTWSIAVDGCHRLWGFLLSLVCSEKLFKKMRRAAMTVLF